jgi:hypothetical protein
MDEPGAPTDDAPSGESRASAESSAPDRTQGEVRHVPGSGIDIWATPDPAQAPIGTVAGGTEVTVVGRRGQWVHLQGADGLDAWADGAALAGIAVGASAAHTPSPAAEPTARAVRGPVVVDKQPMPFTLGTGPVIGALGGVAAIVGAALPWLQHLRGANAFDIPAAFLTGWKHLSDSGFSLGALVVVLAAVGMVVSLIGGGGIVRRILGFVVVVVAVAYVLQWQDYLSQGSRGLGTGLNVWDIVDYGVLVTFGGGLVMVFSPSR